MKIPSSFPFRSLLAAAALAAFAGCAMDTVASRSQEKAEAYAAATPAQKSIIQDHWIDRGFTPDLVYIALGKPDKIQNDNADEVTWIYNNFDARPASAALGGAKISTTTAQGGNIMTSGVAQGTSSSVRPDVGNAPPAESIQSLYVLFYKGRAISMRTKAN